MPIDKEVKIQTFYMRMVLQILGLSVDLGIYRNERMETLTSCARKQEMSDAQLMEHLKQALAENSFSEAQINGSSHFQHEQI